MFKSQTQLHFNEEDQMWNITVTGTQGSVTLLVEEGELFQIRNMLLEYSDGIFYGQTQRSLIVDGKNVGVTIVPTGINFTPVEIQEVLRSSELYHLGGLLNDGE